jgi:sugar phosphate isomerase/epimerase
LVTPLLTKSAVGQSTRSSDEPFGYCLNTSTINSAHVPLNEQFDIAAKAGFTAVEPWVRDIEAWESKGNSLTDVAKHVRDLGLVIPSSIGFAKWAVNDDAERAKGLEEMKRDMDAVVRLGGLRIAAPPSGINRPTDSKIDLAIIAERYRAVLELGEKMGIGVECEFWGTSQNLSRLAEVAYVAVACGHPKACVLPDVYHMYKGGSDAAGLRMLSAQAVHVIHMNDYPADPPHETIADANRVYPGDGIAPLNAVLHNLRDIGFTGYLSLELFNREYWKLSPPKIAQAGFDKMRAAVKKAFA